jgi:predicted neutral ceramidase superfamily lipid hydrolase
MYEQTKISRESPGIFGYFNIFTTKIVASILFAVAPLLVGIASGLLEFLFHDSTQINFFLIIRDAVIFYVVVAMGVLGCLIFHKKAPVLNYRISILINIYGSFFFAISYFLGRFLEILFDNPTFVSLFFILGGLLSYIVQFVIYFSFTTVETPLNVFLALIQPVFGIFFFSIFTMVASFDFFFKAMVFFCSAALIFAVPYATNMFSVSKVYRNKTGIGGYNFIRAFATNLIVDNQDDLIEDYFDVIGKDSSVKIQYFALRSKNHQNLKGLFVIPDIHFGPFKTAGSAALPESIYNRFNEIPGLSVYHTTTTHGENLTRHKYNSSIVEIMEDDIANLQFKEAKVSEFKRFTSGKAKILGTVINGQPLMYITRHPFASDDIMPQVGFNINDCAKKAGYSTDPLIIDAHNAILGDEILVKADSEEGREIQDVANKFLENMKTIHADSNEIHSLYYGVAHDPLSEYPPAYGIGAGGITVHIFKINRQQTALIHIDGNNAVIDFRSRLINLTENKGIDRVEVTTSDSHTVARILSAQGYYPVGQKISINTLLVKINSLIDAAIEDLEPVEVAIKESITSGFRKWGDLGYFDAVIETIEKCLSKSKSLLTAGLIIPTFFSILIALFYFNIPIV